MAFIDRFKDPNENGQDISYGEIGTIIYMLENNHLTKAQFKNLWGLDATDDEGIVKMIASYKALSAEDQKALPEKAMHAGILREKGRISEAQFKAFVGL